MLKNGDTKSTTFELNKNQLYNLIKKYNNALNSDVSNIVDKISKAGSVTGFFTGLIGLGVAIPVGISVGTLAISVNALTKALLTKQIREEKDFYQKHYNNLTHQNKTRAVFKQEFIYTVNTTHGDYWSGWYVKGISFVKYE